MGIWGSSLYANDCSCDVRDTYYEFLQKQLNNDDAYNKITETFNEYFGTDEEPLFWYALAETQWKLGRLMPEVKEKALEWIELQGGMSFWQDSKNHGKGWLKTLNKLKKLLSSSSPPEKVIKPPEKFEKNPWEIGDIYAYQFHLEASKEYQLYGKYIVMQKLSDEEWFDNEKISRIQVYDKIFDAVPAISDLNGIRILPLSPPDVFFKYTSDMLLPVCLNAVAEIHKKRDYPQKYLTFIGNRPDTFNMPLAQINQSNCCWRDIDDFLCCFYQAWKEYDYKICEGKVCVSKIN